MKGARPAGEGPPGRPYQPRASGPGAAVIISLRLRRQVRDTRLVLCLPLRVLVDQVESDVHGRLGRLGLGDQVLLPVAMGGRDGARDPWRLHPERDAVVWAPSIRWLAVI